MKNIFSQINIMTKKVKDMKKKLELNKNKYKAMKNFIEEIKYYYKTLKPLKIEESTNININFKKNKKNRLEKIRENFMGSIKKHGVSYIYGDQEDMKEKETKYNTEINNDNNNNDSSFMKNKSNILKRKYRKKVICESKNNSK